MTNRPVPVNEANPRAVARMVARQNPELGPRWYSIRDAAKQLGMTPQTLWRRIREGSIERVELDGRAVIPKSRLLVLQADPSITSRSYHGQRSGPPRPEEGEAF